MHAQWHSVSVAQCHSGDSLLARQCRGAEVPNCWSDRLRRFQGFRLTLHLLQLRLLHRCRYQLRGEHVARARGAAQIFWCCTHGRVDSLLAHPLPPRTPAALQLCIARCVTLMSPLWHSRLPLSSLLPSPLPLSPLAAASSGCHHARASGHTHAAAAFQRHRAAGACSTVPCACGAVLPAARDAATRAGGPVPSRCSRLQLDHPAGAKSIPVHGAACSVGQPSPPQALGRLEAAVQSLALAPPCVCRWLRANAPPRPGRCSHSNHRDFVAALAGGTHTLTPPPNSLASITI